MFYLPIFLLLLHTSCKNYDADIKNSTIVKIPCSRIVSVGNASICLPKIDGLIECYQNPIVKEMADHYEFRNNKVYGFYLSEEVYSMVDYLGTFPIDDYLKIYAPKSIENLIANIAELNKLSEVLKSGFIETNWQNISKDIDEITSYIKVDQPVMIDKYSVSDYAHTIVLLSKVRSAEIEKVMCMTLNAILVKNRIIFLAYYKDYFDESSVRLTKSKNDYIVLRLIQANR